MTRQASLITADDSTFSISGKLNVIGIYATDITIPTDPMIASQLVFLFIVEADPSDPYQKLDLRIDLPSGDFRQVPVNLTTLRAGEADKIRWSLKFPLLFQNAILKPGPIVATAIHEKGVLQPAAPVIVLRPPFPGPAIQPPNQ
ncbi:MAG: hypothetical protein ABSF87_10915 [Xanthobacteraceae bacterium]|jgi:hypothetical protein